MQAPLRCKQVSRVHERVRHAHGEYVEARLAALFTCGAQHHFKSTTRTLGVTVMFRHGYSLFVVNEQLLQFVDHYIVGPRAVTSKASRKTASRLQCCVCSVVSPQ
jgi:hypothetical protein